MVKIENIQKKHKNGIYELIEIVNKVDNLGYSITDEWLDYIISKTRDSIFIAMDKNILVGIGTCMINEMDKTYAIINILVHPEYRKQGIGSKLHKQIIDYAKDKNIKNMEATIKERLTHGLKFAEERGFTTLLYAWKMDLEVKKVKLDLIRTNNGNLRLRRATIKDNQTYVEIINENFGDLLDEKAIEQLLQDPSISLYILERNGKTIGSVTIQLRTNLSLGYIYDVAITKEYRGQGWGKYLLNKSIEELKMQNINTATLTVTGENKQALSLYHKIGFKEVDIDILGTVKLP